MSSPYIIQPGSWQARTNAAMAVPALAANVWSNPSPTYLVGSSVLGEQMLQQAFPGNGTDRYTPL